MKITTYLENFSLGENGVFENKKTQVDRIVLNGINIKRYTNEFWTSKQRQANSIHEISYRACYKPQLPRFFIDKLSVKNDIIYDPFLGRGTTIIEAAINQRNVIGNDVNPLSTILCEPRLNPPKLNEIRIFLEEFDFTYNQISDIDLSMFFHTKTLDEILSLKKYFIAKKKERELTNVEKWIIMVLTNRLTGHSNGFLSVYTLPPNQAVSQDRQIKINLKRDQSPEYRPVIERILKKSKTLLRDINKNTFNKINGIEYKILNSDARSTKEIKSNTVNLTITSPPFLDVIQYAKDNWLRCWVNGIDALSIEKRITTPKKIEEWAAIMKDVLKELFRITKPGGHVVFEVGEVKNGKIKLDECITPLGLDVGFECLGIVINSQTFTKTSSLWGVSNNSKGTNTNRIVIFKKNS